MFLEGHDLTDSREHDASHFPRNGPNDTRQGRLIRAVAIKYWHDRDHHVYEATDDGRHKDDARDSVMDGE